MSQISLIKSLGANKRLGQNFLVDERAIEREIAYCLPRGKRILEVGPGLGALSAGLAKEAESYTAIEIDERFVPILREKLKPYGNANVILGDFLEFDFSGQEFDLVVSNIPYCIASRVLFRLSEFEFSSAIICIQKELADRMLAQPGSRDYSRLSVATQLLFETESLERFPKNYFYPQPEVTSSLLRLVRREGTNVSERLSLFINACFQHRNKKLRNAVVDSREMLGLSKEAAPVLASTLSLGERRVITLSIDEVLGSFKEYARAVR